MAQLIMSRNAKDWEFDSNMDGSEYFERTEKMLQKLQEESDKVDINKTLVGVLIDFPVADGRAVYRVAKDKPLTLEHIPCGDAWHVDYALIRGLRKSDIVERTKGQREVDAMFRKGK